MAGAGATWDEVEVKVEVEIYEDGATIEILVEAIAEGTGGRVSSVSVLASTPWISILALIMPKANVLSYLVHFTPALLYEELFEFPLFLRVLPLNSSPR